MKKIFIYLSITIGLVLLTSYPTKSLKASWAGSTGGNCEAVLADALTKSAETLIAAVREGRIDDARRLLETGTSANVRPSGKRGWTALMHAVRSKNKGMVELLIEHGADVNAKDYINFENNDGWHALMIAALNADKDMVELLIKYGADINAKAFEKTAFDLAEMKNYREIKQLLAAQKKKDQEKP